MKTRLVLLTLISLGLTSTVFAGPTGGGRKPVTPTEGKKPAPGATVKNEALSAALSKAGLSSEIADRYMAARLTPTKKMIDGLANMKADKRETTTTILDTALVTVKNAEGLALDHLSPQAREMAETLIANAKKMSTKVTEDFLNDSSNTMDTTRLAEAAKSLALSRDQLSNEVDIMTAYDNHKKVLGRDPKELEKCF